MSWYTKRTRDDAPDIWSPGSTYAAAWAEGWNAAVQAQRDEFDAILAKQRESLSLEREED